MHIPKSGSISFMRCFFINGIDQKLGWMDFKSKKIYRKLKKKDQMFYILNSYNSETDGNHFAFYIWK